MDKKSRNEKQYQRALTILGTISSLGMMTVTDILLAYWGGNWLDEYFQTGDHTLRMWCIIIAIGATFMSFFNVIRVAMISFKDEE